MPAGGTARAALFAVPNKKEVLSKFVKILSAKKSRVNIIVTQLDVPIVLEMLSKDQTHIQQPTLSALSSAPVKLSSRSLCISLHLCLTASQLGAP